mgnify:CR=1 FL=1
MVLELIFGLTQTSISDYLVFCTHILVHVLKGNNDAKIKRPTIEKIQQYQQVVSQRHPFLEDVWCTMDGKLQQQIKTNRFSTKYAREPIS